MTAPHPEVEKTLTVKPLGSTSPVLMADDIIETLRALWMHNGSFANATEKFDHAVAFAAFVIEIRENARKVAEIRDWAEPAPMPPNQRVDFRLEAAGYANARGDVRNILG